MNGLTLTVESSDVFGLLGLNGAGKTTTGRLLNGILPLSNGTVCIFKMDPIIEGELIRRKTGVLTGTSALYE